MKKITIIGFLVVIVVITAFVYATCEADYNTMKENNSSLRTEIEKVTEQNQKEEENNSTLNENVNEMKDELQQEIKDYNAWLKLKEKLITALS